MIQAENSNTHKHASQQINPSENADRIAKVDEWIHTYQVQVSCAKGQKESAGIQNNMWLLKQRFWNAFHCSAANAVQIRFLA